MNVDGYLPTVLYFANCSSLTKSPATLSFKIQHNSGSQERRQPLNTNQCTHKNAHFSPGNIFCYYHIDEYKKKSSPKQMSQSIFRYCLRQKRGFEATGKERVAFTHFSQYLTEARNALRIQIQAVMLSKCGQTSHQPGVRESLCSSLTITFKPWEKELTKYVSSTKFAKYSIYYFIVFHQVLFLVNLCFGWDVITQAINLEDIYIYSCSSLHEYH